jgi:tetratricopeptide (TPR) repeat protein
MSPAQEEGRSARPPAFLRRAPRRRLAIEPVAAVVFGLALIFTGTARAFVFAQAESGWIGKRVVPKTREFSLRVNDEVVDGSGKAIDFYRVEQVDGSSLWVKAENQRLRGWASTQAVVPVERAALYFTQQIREHPREAFFRAARAFLYRDEKKLDQALSDIDEAIRLDPAQAWFFHNRGITWSEKKEPDKAIADFGEAVRLDPKLAAAYLSRGAIWSTKKKPDKAIADYSEAIWLDPLCIAAYEGRALAWQSKKEYDKAIVDYNLAIRLDPARLVAYCNRASARAAQRRYAEALADYDAAIRLEPRCAVAYCQRAWLWATCPDAHFRDGAKAVASATKACELTAWKEAGMLATLAAACAEAGDYEKAIVWQTKANAIDAGAEEKTEGEMRLKGYQQRKPDRQRDP